MKMPDVTPFPEYGYPVLIFKIWYKLKQLLSSDDEKNINEIQSRASQPCLCKEDI